jgi:hypothetical protein
MVTHAAEHIPSDARPLDFAAEWTLIREDLEREAAGALRIGQNLIKIRDALKPLGLWLAALREHGMSQPQASRYIRYAEMPERDREVYQRVVGFSLSDAVGEGKLGGRASEYSSTNSQNAEAGIEVPADEIADRRAEIDRQLKLAVEMVDAGERVLAAGPQPPEYADDTARWASKLREVADAVLAVISERLETELTKRLLPSAE